MKRDLIIVVAVVVVGSAVAAGLVVRDYLQRQEEMSQRLAAIHAPPPQPVEQAPAPAPLIDPPPAPKTVVAPSPARPAPVQPKPVAIAPSPAPQPRRMPTQVMPNQPITKEVAREALGYVGADPQAEAVWMQAINEPDRPTEERKDLIEDLNEKGFADPKNLTPDDLPLIQARIDLIERIADGPMDDINARAFAEAYKDLINMRAKLTGG